MRLGQILIGLVLLIFVLPGCSSHKGPVRGKVTYQGKPVLVGSVMFFGPNNEVETASILPNGTYTLRNAPLGPVKVAVQVPSVPPVENRPPAEFDKEGPKRGISVPVVPIPDHYADPAKSGLETVLKPNAVFDIPLK